MAFTDALVRPARMGDLEPLLDLAGAVEGALTTLPADVERLSGLIQLSMNSFGRQVSEPGGEHYLFVLEERGNVLGAAALIARVGGNDPFYTYELRTETFTHSAMDIRKELSVLHLKRQQTGPSELASLTLHRDARGRGLGRLLSLSRLMFLATDSARFESRLIAEHRGVRDTLDRSPFWDWVGQRFFEREFAEVHFLCGLGHKEFIADLMPPYPIYLDLLPPEVASAIGRCHVEVRPARELLEGEGMRFSNEVDIFEAGPVLSGDVRSIRTVAATRRAHLGGISDDPGPRQLVCAPGPDFRACVAPVSALRSGDVGVSGDVVALLGLTIGDPIAWAPVAQASDAAEPLAGEVAFRQPSA